MLYAKNNFVLGMIKDAPQNIVLASYLRVNTCNKRGSTYASFVVEVKLKDCAFAHALCWGESFNACNNYAIQKALEVCREIGVQLTDFDFTSFHHGKVSDMITLPSLSQDVTSHQSEA